MRVLGVRRSPDGAQDLPVGNDLAGMPGKEREEVELLARELDLLPRPGHAMSDVVDLELASNTGGLLPVHVLR